MIATAIFAVLALVVVGAWFSLQQRKRRYEATEPDDGLPGSDDWAG